MTTQKRAPYCSFLLRLWEEDSQGKSSWRIVLVNPHTGDRQGFTDLEQLVVFLKGQMETASPHDIVG
jgi:hypothetical protein